MADYRKEVIEALKQELKEVDDSLLEVPPNPEMGDYAFPCFTLAKEFKMPPPKIAEDLASKIKPSGSIEKVVSNGPYLNFFISSEIIVKETLGNAMEGRFSFDINKKKKMIEYSSPNTNKPLHLGHLRNIMLGKMVSNLNQFIGHDVVQTCVVNDRGIHICKSMLAYMKDGTDEDGNPEEPNEKSDHFVGRYYVLFNDKVKQNPELEEEAKKMLQKWEAGDKDVVALWTKMNKWAIDGFEETYKKLGIKFDKYYYESQLYKHGKDIIMKGFDDGIFQKDEGAVVADMEKEKLGKKVLIRSDGTSLYMTQDIYLAKKKFDDSKMDDSVYVVASEQNLHFRQLFRILDMLGFEYAKNCYHLGYGMVYLPEGKMKSREGTVVDADNIIDEMIYLASDEISKRHELSDEEVKERAQKIGLGALRFFLLKTDPLRDMTYDPKESISFEGETGPYVQYVYARISSILRKAEADGIDNIKLSSIDVSLYDKKELLLIKQLAKFSKAVEESAKNYKPSTLCRYLLDLCQDFNEYYHSTPILKAEKDEMLARLVMILAIRKIIKQGLDLLDIEVLEEM